MDYKTPTRNVYNTHARKFAENSKEYLLTHLKKEVGLFIVNLPVCAKILDLGCGPGRDAAYFKTRGLDPLCYDISSEMLKICQEKGLRTQLGDLEQLDFEDGSFDGVWAHTSLLHMPKAKLPSVLGEIKRILRPRGTFFMGMKEGDFEGWKASSMIQEEEGKRFYALYSDEELREMLKPHFDLVSGFKVVLPHSTYLNYVARNKK